MKTFDGKVRKNRTVPMDRFLSKVVKSDECWGWLGAINSLGYSQFYDGTRNNYAHRFSFLNFVGPIPPGLVIDHICRNRSCSNPKHLRAVTMGVNSNENSVGLTALNILKKDCIHGHPFTERNTLVITLKNGNPSRVCRTCSNEQSNRYAKMKRRERGLKKIQPLRPHKRKSHLEELPVDTTRD